MDIGEITKKFNPVEILKLLVEVDKNAASALVAGLAVAAIVPIVRYWEIDNTTSLIIVAFVLGSGVALRVIVLLFSSDPAFRPHRVFLGWLLIAVITLPILTMFTSAVMGSASPFRPVYCQAQFWRNCDDVEEELTNARRARLQEITHAFPNLIQPASAAPAAPLSFANSAVMRIQATPSDLRHNHKVLIQFAGLIDRQRMLSFSGELARKGWQVSVPQNGGLRTQKAAGFNEIRYSDAQDERAAKLLSDDVNGVSPGGQPSVVRRSPGIEAGTLQVWISR
jgi:hypothetical protein